MLRSAALALVLAVSATQLAAESMSKQPMMNQVDEEADDDYLVKLQKDAATYRLRRASAPATDREDAADARAYIEKADRHRRWAEQDPTRSGSRWHWKRVRAWAKKGYRTQEYGAWAADCTFLRTLAAARLGDISEARRELAHLYLYFPDYDSAHAYKPDMGLQVAMQAALDAAEKAQRFTAHVDLAAERPADVIDLTGDGYYSDYNHLFHFLTLYGDRSTIAARAMLGLARARLLGSDRRQVDGARIAYENFLERYPKNELTFTALCELALTHLVTYRGEHYDVGALVHANSVIDLAEAEAGGVAERVTLIQAYRKRIRSWHQDRDLQVARWYRDRNQPPGLGWLREPSGADWTRAARLYYQEVVRRDPTSTQGRAAQRELAALPVVGDDELGGPPIAGGG